MEEAVEEVLICTIIASASVVYGESMKPRKQKRNIGSEIILGRGTSMEPISLHLRSCALMFLFPFDDI